MNKTKNNIQKLMGHDENSTKGEIYAYKHILKNKRDLK